jgi:cytochrome oxidase assembly protein ShyY1
VTATGTYDPAQTLLLPGREMGQESGYAVVTPLLAADGTVTPVLRGWVADPSDPGTTPPDGEVSLRGIVQPLETDADAAVDARGPLPDGQLPALTSVALFSTYPYSPGELRQAQIVVTDEQPTTAAAPARVPVAEAAPRPVGVSAWRHLSYAWQWWLFAGAAVVFWAAFVRAGVREERERRDQQAGSEAVPVGPGDPAEASHQGLP